MVVRSLRLGGLVVASLFVCTVALAGQPAVEPSKGGEVMAKVNDEAIGVDEFETAVARTARQRFYHGRVEEKKVVELRREVLDELVLERLLLKEAQKRGVKADMAEVEDKIKALDERYASAEQWKEQRDQVLPEMRARMIANSQKAVLEQQVRVAAPPNEAELTKFYEANKDLFTEPQRDHVAVILLKVDPSSTRDVWQSAQEEGVRIKNKVLAGTSFAELAALHSGDESAQRGGDMGYLHRGMLADEAQQAVDKLKVGEVTDPIEVLQGYGLFKLVERTEPSLRTLDQVRERATELYVRKKGDDNWVALKANLRKKAKIWISPKVASAQ